MKARLALVAGALSIAFGANVGAQQLEKPTDVDLKAAYCIPIAKESVNLANEMLHAAEAQSKDSTKDAEMRSARLRVQTANSNLSKLQHYLDPRVEHLDSSTLTAAMQRGEADYSTMATATNDSAFRSCSVQCIQAAKSGKNLNIEECTQQCAPANVRPVMDRVRLCTNPTALLAPRSN